MCRRLCELNAAWAFRGLAPLENGAGIHWSEVLQGASGSALRKEFTIIGDAGNTASRVEGLTRDHPQVILVTEELFGQLDPAERDLCTPPGRVRVKGRQEDVGLFGVAA